MLTSLTVEAVCGDVVDADVSERRRQDAAAGDGVGQLSLAQPGRQPRQSTVAQEVTAAQLTANSQRQSGAARHGRVVFHQLYYMHVTIGSQE